MNQNLCILGDSIAKGVVLDARRNRYTIAKENLGAQITRMFGHCVTNLSKFGCTVTDGLARFERQKDALQDCKTVLMNFGGNDSDFLWQEISAAPDALHKPKTPIDVFAQTYLKLIERVRKSGFTPVLLNLPPVDHVRYFAWISRELNADNILKWLGGTSEFIYRWHEQYNVAVHKLAQTANVKLIDIRSAFLECRDYGEYFSDDGIHPNEKGYFMISEIVLSHRGLRFRT